ncbi:arylsulfatase [Bacteroidales bacterium]|nr:arylsulfatase [Bacteroidales bacterium]
MKKIVPIVLIISFALASCKQMVKTDTQKPPNVVIILADDQGWGDLSCNGNININTPNLDKLSESGVSFDNFYVSPVCSPTRAEFLTGRYAVRGGVYSTSQGGERLDLDEQTIAEVFKAHGYRTAAYGKWHNGMQYPYHPNGRGFDDFYGYCSGHWGNYFSPMLEHNGELVKGKGYLTDDLTNKALEFINANQSNPFFLYLPLNTPHSPMQVPDSLWERFKDIELAEHRYKDQEKPEHTKAALAMGENIDWNVGRVMQKLEKLKLEENTILIYFSDNGPNGYRYNGGMKGKKGQVDEGGVKTPFFMQWKGKIKPGYHIKQIAGAIDIFPTLMKMAGIDVQTKNTLDGISLEPLILREESVFKDRIIVNYWKGRVALRNQQYRLDEHNKLYDMVNDPMQLNDISKKAPEVRDELIAYKEKWENEVLTELPEADTRTFSIGHPNWTYNQLPARDAIYTGNIKRSSIWPNCSFLTNWTNEEDSIVWNIDLLEDGKFEAIVYYTCSEENIGSQFELQFNGSSLTSSVNTAHNPPIVGKDKDRYPRDESYTKEFKPLKMGEINLKKGKGTLSLKATNIKASEVMDFRLLMLKRI